MLLLLPACRAAIPLQVTFLVPEPLQEDMEVLPKHGLVQGNSSFSAQLKFLPTKTIFDRCGSFFMGDEESQHKIEVPMNIQVANQVPNDLCVCVLDACAHI